MANFIVKIDNITDEQLEFAGWIKVDQGEEFSAYWNPHYNEFQPVSNAAPRYLMVDDWNDARLLADGGPVITGPQRH